MILDKKRHDWLRLRVMSVAAHLERAAEHDEREARFLPACVGIDAMELATKFRDHRLATANFLRGEADLLLKAAEEIEEKTD